MDHVECAVAKLNSNNQFSKACVWLDNNIVYVACGGEDLVKYWKCSLDLINSKSISSAGGGTANNNIVSMSSLTGSQSIEKKQVRDKASHTLESMYTIHIPHHGNNTNTVMDIKHDRDKNLVLVTTDRLFYLKSEK